MTEKKRESNVVLMISVFHKFFYVLCALAVFAPSLLGAMEESCEAHELVACHSTISSDQSSDTDSSPHSETDCPAQHICSHSLAYVGQAPLALVIREKSTEYGVNSFFSLSSTDLEGPFQPPEA